MRRNNIKFDTHIVIFENRPIFQEIAAIENLWTKVRRIVSGSESIVPSYICTKEAQTKEEMEINHAAWLFYLRRMELSALVESEMTIDDVSLTYYPSGADERKYEKLRRINSVPRSVERKHWGDIHLDIPEIAETKELCQGFQTAGYQHIVLEKEDGLHRIVTAQCENWKFAVRRVMIEMIYECYEKFGRYQINDEEKEQKNKIYLREEKLLLFDAAGNAEPLPIAVGYKPELLR